MWGRERAWLRSNAALQRPDCFPQKSHYILLHRLPPKMSLSNSQTCILPSVANGGFADEMKEMEILRWRRYTEVASTALRKSPNGGLWGERGSMITADFGAMCSEDWRRNQESKKAGGFQKLGEAKGFIVSWILQREQGSVKTLILSWENTFWTI